MKSETSKPSTVTIVTNGNDWEGLYIDGELINENHSLRTVDILAALGIDIKHVEVSCDWLGDIVCSLPKLESEIPKEYIL